jgi:hypothetical protein
MTIMNYRHN